MPPGLVDEVQWAQGPSASVTRWREDVKLAGAVALAQFDDGRPAVTRHNHTWYAAGWMDGAGWRHLLKLAAQAASIDTLDLPAEVRVSRRGDWVFALSPAPYFEANEDSYIQQFTKIVVNVAGAPTDWDAELGLPAEIVPLDKPYGLWAGNVFRGIVKGDGQPVPFAEIEVEFLNHEPDMQANTFAEKAAIEAPHDSLAVQTIKADANGVFVYAMPKAGWWGFAALGAGPVDKYKDKELSQDAVIWVQAKPMP